MKSSTISQNRKKEEDRIVLHCSQLKIIEAEVKWKDEEVYEVDFRNLSDFFFQQSQIPLSWTYNEITETVTFIFTNPFREKSMGNLWIIYEGTLSPSLFGFYRSTYHV